MTSDPFVLLTGREDICGDSFVHINLSETSKNTSSLNVIWNNENWWDAINVTYYRVILKYNIGGYEYQIAFAHIDSMEHVSQWNMCVEFMTNLLPF